MAVFLRVLYTVGAFRHFFVNISDTVFGSPAPQEKRAEVYKTSLLVLTVLKGPNREIFVAVIFTEIRPV